MNAVSTNQTPVIPQTALSIPALLGVKDVCKVLRISRSTLYRWLEENAFPQPFKINGATRWLASEVTEFMLSKVAVRGVSRAGGLQ